MIDRNPGVEDGACLERDGYLVVRKFFGADSVAQLVAWAAGLKGTSGVAADVDRDREKTYEFRA
jgi:hypothetical protein